MTSAKLGEIKGPFIVWLFFILYYVALNTVFSRSSSSGTTTVPAEFSLGIALSLLINLAIVWCVPLVFLVVFVAYWEKQHSWRKTFAGLGLRKDGVKRSLLWSIVLFPLVMIVGAVGYMLGLFGVSASAFVFSDGQTPLWFLWYMVIQAFFPVAVVEEMFARGYLLDRLMPLHPSGLGKALPAILLSSALFTLWHVPGYLASYQFSVVKSLVLLTGNVFPISVILSLAYVRARSRNILGPILIHFLLDSLTVIAAIAQYT